MRKSTLYPQRPEMVFALGAIKQQEIPEIKIRLNRSARKKFEGQITSTVSAADFIRKTIPQGELGLQEQFIVLYLNRANNVIGYYRHSKGGMTGTLMDIRLVLAAALKSGSVSIIVAHNHPSGNTKPSEADRKITQRLKEAAALMEITLLDHIIVTKTGYSSFVEEGLLGIRENLHDFQVGGRVKGKKGTAWEDQTGTVIFYHAGNLEILDDASGEHIGVPKGDFEKIPGVGWEGIIKKSFKPGAIWLRIGTTQAAQELEAWGLYPKGTAIQKLKEGHTLWTPQAKYRLQYLDEPEEYMPGLTSQQADFVLTIEHELENGIKRNKKSVEALAASFGIFDKNMTKELTELAIVRRARDLAHQGRSIEARFQSIVDLYNSQVNLSHRTSHSILLQQYSTPAPIAYLAGIFCRIDEFEYKDKRAFEPSAGNGLLTIASSPGNFVVNEIDHVRNRTLFSQRFASILRDDATRAFPLYPKHFDAVLTNPPFGKVDEKIDFSGFPIKTLEHLMAIRALDTMKDSGRAAIIIGGHTKWDQKGRIQAGANRIFFNYLYSHYFVTDVIMIDGHKLYSRQGTSFNVRLILIARRKPAASGAAPVYDPNTDVPVKTFDALFDRVMLAREAADNLLRTPDIKELEAQALKLNLDEEELGTPYLPASNACIKLDTQVPDSMSYEIQAALEKVKQEVGGDIDNFVRHRLGYPTKAELCDALSAEQIDAVALAIYNIEARGQGMIIGDQTGIGKGRIAAAMIRYGVQKGLKPIFITEKANLFSDIYRDLVAIGSSHFRPFIVNARESKTDIKDEDGNVVYQALSLPEQNAIFSSKQVPASYDFIVGTYSQFNSPEKKPEKPNFLMSVAEDNLLIMDEAHNSSGSSNTGEFLQRVVALTQGVVFLSATFAKRPDNMPIYAMKTAISDATMSKEELVEAIVKGGVALQEVLASQLVAEGQMIRRERSFEGVEVNYISLDELKEEHQAICDNITETLRDIIGFQTNHIDKQVEQLDDIAVAEGKEVELREGTSQAGVDNTPYFSKVFNVINQMLFSIKAEAVADRAIQRLKEGKKPVIAFASTMGSFIEQMENSRGLPVSDGDVIGADFAEVLRRGLEGVLRYTERDINGEATHKMFDVATLPLEAQAEYQKISERIHKVATGISISPIDVVISKIEAAGYTVSEVTGRKYKLQLDGKGQGLVLSRKKENTNDAFRKFNNNEVDVLMINQSGSTGASAHAIVTPKVPADKVKQRVMIVLQPELDINTEVQKRGRINRTGQILKPIYDYMVSAIPAEKRLMMMLQKKLKSLDANTTSNQRQSARIMDVPDFLNKYGNKIVEEYLQENPEIDALLGHPLMVLNNDALTEVRVFENAAQKVSGRVAIMSVKMQQEFYDEITERYNDYVEYLKQVGEYDLEVETMNLNAETLRSRVVKMGKGGESPFGKDSILETVMADILKKPFNPAELNNLITEALDGKQAAEISRELLDSYQAFAAARLAEEKEVVIKKYEELIGGIASEPKIQKVLEKKGHEAWLRAMQEREKELIAARESQITQLENGQANRGRYLERLFKFFYPGRLVNYPIHSYGQGQELIPAVCLGFVIDRKKKNPYTPSAIKVRFAIASSQKYITLPASYSEALSAIMGVSGDMGTPTGEELLNRWENAVKQRTLDRGVRHIVTGNLLQAFSAFKGKLVSYTKQDGNVQKGILMPEHWLPSEQGDQEISVPILAARNLVKSLVPGNMITTSTGLSFARQGNFFKLMVPGSRERGGPIYLDKEILALVQGNNFDKVSNMMVALLPQNQIDALLELLQSKHNQSITIPEDRAYLLEKMPSVTKRRSIELPPPEEEKPLIPPIRLLELEAMALDLDLAA